MSRFAAVVAPILGLSIVGSSTGSSHHVPSPSREWLDPYLCAEVIKAFDKAVEENKQSNKAKVSAALIRQIHTFQKKDCKFNFSRKAMTKDDWAFLILFWLRLNVSVEIVWRRPGLPVPEKVNSLGTWESAP